MTDRVLRRVLRRESHSPRTVAMIVVASVSVVVLAYLLVEVVVSVVRGTALLWSPEQMIAWATTLPAAEPRGAVITGAAVAVVVGVVLLVLALRPGRRARRELLSAERAILVDNGVLASSLARGISAEAGVAPGSLVVGVGHRTVDVTLRPELGVAVDPAELTRIAESEVERAGLAGRTRTRARVLRADDEAKEAAR